jgi:hypothetical protein
MKTKKGSKQSSRKKIYLISPITGVPNQNEPRLKALEKAWTEQGWDVISPARSFGLKNNPDELTLHRHSIAELAKCDAAAVLSEIKSRPYSFGWKEIDIAIEIFKIPVYDADFPTRIIPFTETVAGEADRLVYSEKEDTYGRPDIFFEKVARVWQEYTRSPIRPSDVAAMMVMFKLQRLRYNPTHRDTYVDIIGYAIAGARAMGIEP